MTLVETKGLGTVNGETVQQRADRIDRDIIKHAEALDAKYPGSKVLDEKNRYGVNGNCSISLSLLALWETALPISLSWLISLRRSRSPAPSSCEPQTGISFSVFTADF